MIVFPLSSFSSFSAAARSGNVKTAATARTVTSKQGEECVVFIFVTNFRSLATAKYIPKLSICGIPISPRVLLRTSNGSGVDCCKTKRPHTGCVRRGGAHVIPVVVIIQDRHAAGHGLNQVLLSRGGILEYEIDFRFPGHIFECDSLRRVLSGQERQ